MKYKFEKAFARDFKNLKNKKLAIAILECTKNVSDAQSIKDIPNLKKSPDTNLLTGFAPEIIVLD